MAKVTMGRTRFKIQRRLGLELPGLGKAGPLERRPYAPGQHGQRRRKLSEYAVRLTEKQKIIFHYGLRENQIRNYIRKAKKIKAKAWVDTMIENLEKRTDNVVFRLQFAPSMIAARQMVIHGHVLVDGKRVSVPHQAIKVGQTITLTDKGFKSGNYLQAKARPRLEVPAFLNKEPAGAGEVGKLVANPLPDDIPFAFTKQMVTEFYWKVK
jgi:small subunit ribosomal protein S4